MEYYQDDQTFSGLKVSPIDHEDEVCITILKSDVTWLNQAQLKKVIEFLTKQIIP